MGTYVTLYPLVQVMHLGQTRSNNERCHFFILRILCIVSEVSVADV